MARFGLICPPILVNHIYRGFLSYLRKTDTSLQIFANHLVFHLSRELDSSHNDIANRDALVD